MSFTSDLDSFAARVRGFIRASARSSSAPVEPREFERLALELYRLQFKHNAPYRRFCEARGARPEAVTDWRGIPAMPVSAFKELELTSLPVAERRRVFHSSGTTCQRPSRHYHNAQSLALYEESLWAWFRLHFQLPNADCQLAILTPRPALVPHSSLVHMFETIRRTLGAEASAYVGMLDEAGGWALDWEAALERLSEATAEEQPILLLGTAFSYVHLLDQLAERDLRFKLPPGSCAMETGGYKGRSRVLPKEELHALISQRLGIPGSRILCEYGMSELSSQAYDCAAAASRITHHESRTFQFPPWARVQIVSPETGLEVSEGETGLICVLDLANVYSVMAVQTEDLGVRNGAGFTLVGRAAMVEPRGCSLMVA